VTGTIVVGAGMSGLVRARELVRRGEDVALLEASSRVGGAVRTLRKEGFLLELGPNTVRPTVELWRLVEELGLRDEALLADPRLPRYVSWNGTLHPLPTSARGLLRTRLLSSRAKRRILGEPFVRAGSDPEESVHSFFSRRLGPEVADRIVEPFVGGVFAGSSRKLAVSAAFPALARWEKERGSLFRGVLAQLRARRAARSRPPRGLLSFREGLQRLPEAIASHLGARLEPSTPVETLNPRAGGGWAIKTSRGARETGRVVLATPAWETARLLEPFAPDAARALRDIPHPFLAVVHLSWPVSELPRPLHGFGYLAVPDRESRVLGAVWSSSLFAGRAPAGQTLITAFLGGERDHGASQLDDEEIQKIAAREIGRTLGARKEPRALLLTRYDRSIPQYVAGHAARMEALARAEFRFPGLELIGNYREGVSVGDVVRAATQPA
jgi:protoporphyrinogen/coproporphyrinogen III oxidase